MASVVLRRSWLEMWSLERSLVANVCGPHVLMYVGDQHLLNGLEPGII